ncbi:NEDD4-binding protein 2-like 2 isoform X3 [Marmota monax]|uniref:NEDD4-binding protein 2-like 2 isoform X3 n=1 Tax=Marmota monax TaxID=9995 RepID=UPI001EB05CA8|nr:NEDD4-binding protein 2-like 2 isoform X3 [Marmota monax]XP_046310071.1 NEDD4-binding protein 2-like 2 isoform X3 [Marmota monax]
MPYGEIEAKFLGPGEELTNEPCYKKLKSTAEDYVFPDHGSASFHRIQEKTGNNQDTAAIIDARGHSYPQEDKTQSTELLKPVCDRLDVIESIGSQVLQDGNPSLVSRDDEIYSTSKAFIGPIYKPPEKRKCSEKRNKADTLSGVNDKGRLKEKQKFNSKKSEIDTELTQFYKEIEELENEKDDLEVSCKEVEPSQEQLIQYYQGHKNDVLKSDEENKDLKNALELPCGYQQYLGNEAGKYTFDGQVIPAFCDISFASFRPEWQSTHPFIVPHGPPLPSFNYHLNIQQFNAPPNLPPNVFHAQDDSHMQNGYDVHNCHVNWSCLTFDQNNEYTDCSENNSSVHSGNGCSVQDGYVSNSFCEIREGCWKDPSMDKHSGMDRFVNQQFQEEKLNKLQKLLILLRGLPGSGKTTLSRILLGQSRDGIVFSTDDYFHHQDGYRYNVNQLGDAHDWNQNRAKQAIDQGRSPVIIDNTNTQAWEMKPYVEMAIGKGYRVEFHEPETWWKFDPEELEKRNKHGVSRKKIAQMLDRYEYQMSISIVMNSVEPSQKSTQRPPPPQERQRENILKKTGHRLSKTKQKSKRKRNKKHNILTEIVDENSFETLNYLKIGDQVPNEEEDFEENERESVCPFTGGHFVNGYKEKSQKSKDPEDNFPNVISIVELDKTPDNYFPKENDDLFLTLSSIPNESSVTCPTGTQNLSYVTRDDSLGMKIEKHVGNRQNLSLDTQELFADKTPCSFMQKREMVNKSLSNEPILCHQRGSRTSDNVLREEQGVHTTKNNYWAFFTTNSSEEELQRGSERQSYFGSWPEGPHKFVCEQRPKKDRSRKLTHPDSGEQLIKLISTSEGVSGPGSGPEILTEEKLLIENEDLSHPTETIDSFMKTDTNILSSYLSQLDITQSALQSTTNKKRRENRILNLVPNLLGQSHFSAKEGEKCGLLPKNFGLNIIWGEIKDRISEINNQEENEQKVMIFDHHSLWFYPDIIKDSSLNIGGNFYSHYLSFSRLGYALYFYRSPIPSLVLHYISSFWMVSFTNKKTFLTFKSQTRIGNKLKDVGFISSEILIRQPDTLCSLRGTSERFGEKLKRWEESKPLQCLPTEDLQNLTSTDFNTFELPLSKGFAFQLVTLFGSPGVPMESLLPDDYVIPLDWKTLKMIYLQWKMSIEKRQKKIG